MPPPDPKLDLSRAVGLLERGHQPFDNRDQYLAWDQDVGAFLSRIRAEATAEPTLTPVEREYIEYHADAPVPAPVLDAVRAAYPKQPHPMTLNYITVERLQELCDEPHNTLPRAELTGEERAVLDDIVRIVADWLDESREDPAMSMDQIETVACVQVAEELARRAARKESKP